MVVEWEAVPGCIGYTVQYGKPSLFDSWVTAPTTGVNGTTCTIPALQPATTYVVQVGATYEEDTPVVYSGPSEVFTTLTVEAADVLRVQARLTAAEASAASQAQAIAQLKAQVAEGEERLAKERQDKDARLSELQDKFEDTFRKLGVMEGIADKAKHAKAAAEADLQRAHATNEGLAERLHAAIARTEKLEVELAGATAAAADAEACASPSGVEDLRKKNAALTAKVKVLSAQLLSARAGQSRPASASTGGDSPDVTDVKGGAGSDAPPAVPAEARAKPAVNPWLYAVAGGAAVAAVFASMWLAQE